jgi:hypothetical protein
VIAALLAVVLGALVIAGLCHLASALDGHHRQAREERRRTIRREALAHRGRRPASGR